MHDLEKKILAAISQLSEKLQNEAKRKSYKINLNPGTPATEQQITKYETYLNFRLPESYRAFLRLHNGYQGLAYGADMLSIEDVMPGGAYFERIAKWKKACEEYGNEEVLSGIVIADSDQPNNWTFIDPSRKSSKEESVIVRWLNDTSSEFDNIFGYFEYIEMCCQAP